ncbi:lysine decarboxylase LdcC [Providencia burhodogranariea]|uniref:Lysine decarboxylase CadA n=1 Tax=Providencia burhodogranariea DSM 19968 TaxID=1141662 RepID=K8WQU3_9GAMM|nr:lysine decarboxylase LdcC [Providencia burhodogranariea]EKT62988.1 lysine decarboxylase CadA [Providencia burhodogranariea DSM 19968]
MKSIVILSDERIEFENNFLSPIEEELRYLGFNIIIVSDEVSLIEMADNNTRICSVIFYGDSHNIEFCKEIIDINENIPKFIIISDQQIIEEKFSQLRSNVIFIEYIVENVIDITIKIKQAADEYLSNLLPPFTKALFSYASKEKNTFCTPGHMGGIAFTKSPVGTLFYDFYGKNTFRSDVSISMTGLGALLDHSGPHRAAEDYIAETFNADRSFIITNGTSTANKIVGMYSCYSGATVIVDRNCHKSIAHLMMMINITPIYLKPTRNSYGILGGIPKKEFTKEHIENLLCSKNITQWPTHAIITNSTYDGILYDTQYIKETLPVNSIHFDSAWIPYSNFNPIYENKSGMGGSKIKEKVIFETQSTHKLLAAFSQASMIHIKGDFNEKIFNETYMMHTSTSPLYSIVSSCEISAAMMRGQKGKRLISQAIDLAIDFRKDISRLHRESEDWFFSVWQPDCIDKVMCWSLDSADNWHGFRNIDDNNLFLDPIKVTLLTPGLDRDDNLSENGIPASIVAEFLDEKGIIVEKTGPYSLLFLFSIGVDKQKSVTLLKVLMEFKRVYDNNSKISDVMPRLYEKAPLFYEGMRMQDLTQGIHNLIVKYKLPELMYNAFEQLPFMVLTPHDAFQQEIRGNVVECDLSEMIGKISANMILPYPPGVPLIMPGEKLTIENKPILSFIEMLCEIGIHFPGFETDIHGVYKNKDGKYVVSILSTP